MSKQIKKPRPILELIIKVGIACALIGFIVWIAIPSKIRPRTSSREWKSYECINNLREIDAAKNEWAFEHHLTKWDIVTVNQLTNYFRSAKMPQCPSGGIYTIGKIGEPPTCSLGTTVTPAHVLP